MVCDESPTDKEEPVEPGIVPIPKNHTNKHYTYPMPYAWYEYSDFVWHIFQS